MTIKKLNKLFTMRPPNRDLDDELHFHLEKQFELNLTAGMPADEARRQAMITFGGVQQTKEAVRENSWSHFAEVLLRDVQYALRMLRRSPGFTAVAVLTLALGIGANTAIFSLLDSILLKTLPVADPDRLVSLSRSTPAGPGESFTYPQFERLAAAEKTYAEVFAFAYRPARLVFEGQTKEVAVQLASDKYFRALGVPAVTGRVLTANDGQGPRGQPVALISQRLWNQFSRDPLIVGKALEINGASVTVVGVMPAGFFGASMDFSADVWLPMRMQPVLDGSSLLDSSTNWVMVMARLRPGIRLSQARAEANVIFQGFLHATQADAETLQQQVELAPGGRPSGKVRQAALAPFAVLMVITGLVLLIACTNIANLLLSRASARRGEMATRSALGASRSRLIRQLLTEGMLIALLGGIAAVFVARIAADTLVAHIIQAGGRFAVEQLQFHPSIRILVFTGLVSLLSGLLFCLAPSLQASHVDLATNLKEGHRSGGSSRLRWNKILLITQVAVCVPVLVAAGLFIRSFQKMVNVDLGFEAKGLIQIQLKASSLSATPEQMSQMWAQLLEKTQQLPGVQAASLSRPGFFVHSSSTTWIGKADKQHFQRVVSVTPDFFTTMQVSLRGRTFSAQENTPNGPRVAILNKALAQSLFPGADPLGQRVATGAGETFTVIGIAKDTKYESVFAGAPPIFYVPLAQAVWESPNSRVMDVRASVDPATMQMTLRHLAESQFGFQTDIALMEDVIGQSLLVQKLIAQITGLFGGLSLLLAAVGLYGLMAYMVAQRTREIGIRIALGAQRTNVISLMLKETFALVAVGSIIGLVVAAAGTRLLGNQLFGLTAIDPLSFGGAAAVLLGVALLAGYSPARRASRVDPIVALRHG